MFMTLRKSVSIFASLIIVPASLLGQEDTDEAASATEPEVTPASGPSAELAVISDRMMAALRNGEPVDPADLAALDDLIEKYADDNSEDVAQILLTKAAFVFRVLDDPEAALPIFEEIVTRFDGTRTAQFAAQVLGSIEEERAQAERLANFVGSEAPELDFNWVSEGETAKLSDLRGQVVVLDFWATWCGPCVRSFPQVRELTDHYADSAVAVVGVTSLQGQVHGLESSPINTRSDPDREHTLMTDYMAKYDINWTIAFSEQEVFNDDYGVTGIPHMAIIAPDGTVRHTGLHPAMPHAEKTAMIDAILEEFALPTPANL